MTDLELLAELIDDLYRDLRPEIESLSQDEFHWRPDLQANSIGVTVWHVARGLDFLATRVLSGRPAKKELWHTQGWREKTGYDPRGTGYGGWEVLTGFTWDDVQAIPKLSTRKALEYLHQSCSLASSLVRSMSAEQAQSPVLEFFDGKLTSFRWVKEFYKGFQAHIGEIMAIKVLIARSKTV